MNTNKEDLAKVIEKINKLFRLSQSANEHEAALAAEKAREMLEAYNLSTFDLEEKKFSSDVQESVLMETTRLIGWKHLLITYLSGIFDLKYMWSPQGARRVIGLPQDIEVFKFTYGYLEGQVFKHSKGIERKYLNSYRKGIVVRICQRLQESKEKVQQESNCTELVVVKESIIEDFIAHKYDRVKTVKSKTAVNEAFRAGFRKGDEIPLHSAVNERSGEGALVY